MDCLADYEILADNPTLSSILTVKHKPTGNAYTLQSIACDDLSSDELKALVKKIQIRTNLSHPNILKFHEHIQHEDVIYVKQEFCEYGTLANFLRKECVDKDRQLHEGLLCRILYQIVFALKTVECFMGRLNLETIHLTEHYTVKLYNFYNLRDGNSKSQKQKEIKMSQLGTIIFELSTLKPFEKSTFDNDLHNLTYSVSFKGLIASMIKDNSEIKKHINKILCHPTVLLHSSQWSKDSCFIENQQQTLKKSTSSELCEDLVQDYTEKLEKLRKREAAIQIKEQLLKEQERQLIQKEKKLQIMERTVKEKLQQAELYLKRSREGRKSISSGSSKSSNQSQTSTQPKKMLYEESDPNYVSCGDSDVFPTSTKLQVDRIVKPQTFSRTMSERRIRFKTSPLKDHNFSRKSLSRKTLKHAKIIEENMQENKENVPTIKLQTNKTKDLRRKTLFLPNEYENESITIKTQYEQDTCDTKSIGWTEETKKYAFEMLRMMKEDDKGNNEIKHTFL